MSHPKKKFIFTLTSGRTGTKYLTHLFKRNFPDAITYHEILKYNAFGVDTPDLSHLLTFNHKGNTKLIQQFWRHKFHKIATTKTDLYIETSHLLMKAGLVENLHHLTAVGDVHLIALKRDLLQVFTSFQNRFSFLNTGSMWLWTLDPFYPLNIVSPFSFHQQLSQTDSNCLWYLCEIATRVEYYKLLLKNQPCVTIHDIQLQDLNSPLLVTKFFRQLGLHKTPNDVTIPPPQNKQPANPLITPITSARVRDIIDNLNFNPRALALNHFTSGHSFNAQT